MEDKVRGRDIGVSAPPEYRGIRLYENSWALIVGINEYLHPGIPALQYAENDARAMAETLPALGFPPENIFVLLASREPVTRAAINRVVEHELNPRMSRDDRLVVHFAGHGVSCKVWERTTGYLLLSDSVLHSDFPSAGNPHLEKSPADAYEMRQLLSLLDNLPAKHKLLLIDSCFSGFMAGSRSVEGIRMNDARVKLWSRDPVTQVLTAGRSGQKAWEDPRYQHGIFTWFVLKALQGHADPRGDGLITFQDLSNFVRDRVAAQGYDQDPQALTDGEGLFMFLDPDLKAREAQRRDSVALEEERRAQAEAEVQGFLAREKQRLFEQEARERELEAERKRAALEARIEEERRAKAEAEVRRFVAQEEQQRAEREARERELEAERKRTAAAARNEEERRRRERQAEEAKKTIEEAATRQKAEDGSALRDQLTKNWGNIKLREKYLSIRNDALQKLDMARASKVRGRFGMVLSALIAFTTLGQSHSSYLHGVVPWHAYVAVGAVCWSVLMAALLGLSGAKYVFPGLFFGAVAGALIAALPALAGAFNDALAGCLWIVSWCMIGTRSVVLLLDHFGAGIERGTAVGPLPWTSYLLTTERARVCYFTPGVKRLPPVAIVVWILLAGVASASATYSYFEWFGR